MQRFTRARILLSFLFFFFFFYSLKHALVTGLPRDSLIDFVTSLTLTRDELIFFDRISPLDFWDTCIYDFSDAHDTGYQTYDAIIGGIYHLKRFDHAKTRRLRLNAFDRLIVLRCLVRHIRETCNIIDIVHTQCVHIFLNAIVCGWYYGKLEVDIDF